MLKINVTDSVKAADQASSEATKGLAVMHVAALYLGLALLQISDSDYLNGLGQELPIIRTMVPGQLFLVIAPVILLFLHLSVLMRWNSLRTRVLAAIDKAGCRDLQDSQRLLNVLHPFPLTAHFFGAHAGAMSRFISVGLVFAGLIGIPMLTLVWAQVRSLPLHNEYLTMWHRTLIVLDIIAVWHFMPLARMRQRSFPPLTALVSTLLLLAFVFFDAVVPRPDVKALPEPANLTDRWWHMRRLDLRGAVIQPRKGNSEDKNAKGASIDLRGTDLRFADLTLATLIRPAIYGANFRGAILDRTRFVETISEDLRPLGQNRTDQKAPNFSFVTAAQVDFSGQELVNADFTGATAVRSKFAGANLTGANFTAASLDFSDFRGADLKSAKLRMASMLGADLRCAHFRGADLVASDMRGVSLFRNSFSFARLHLADFTYAKRAMLTEKDIAEVRASSREGVDADKEWRCYAPTSIAGLSSEHMRNPFRLLDDNALFPRFDYRPMPFDGVTLPRTTFVELLRAYMHLEVARRPELAQALGRRKAVADLFVLLLHTRDGIPRVGKPNTPPIEHLQALLVDPMLLMVVQMKNPAAYEDSRYDDWANADQQTPKSPAKLPHWFPSISKTLNAPAISADDRRALTKLLWNAANSGDALAQGMLPSLVSGLDESGKEQMAQWLEEQAKRRAPDGEIYLGIAGLLDPSHPLSRKLTRMAGELLGTRRGRAPSENEDVPGGRVAVNYSAARGLPDAFSSRELLGEPIAGLSEELRWRAIGRAAYRGVPTAQRELGAAMARHGDFGGAKKWLAEAAAGTGEAEEINAFAWFLATCPDDKSRDAVQAISLASEALRRYDAVAGAQTPTPLLRAAILETLAAAYAAGGDFQRAVKLQTEVIGSDGQGRQEKRATVAERLRLYKEKAAWIEHPIVSY